MSVEIRELTPALEGDYLAFFDGPAFADFPYWSGCFCTFYRDPRHDGNSLPETIPHRRGVALEMLRAGEQQGLLAYVDGAVAGWCNAGPRSGYAALRRYAETIDDPTEPVGVTMCFVIAAPHRGKGLATALLRAAVDSFKRAGLAVAEAYPATAAPSGPFASRIPATASQYHGPLAMYLGAGYAVHKQWSDFAVVRKAL